MAFFFERDVCQVLEDLKKCYETRNFSLLPGLLAELDIMKDRRENYEDMDRAYKRLVRTLPKLKVENEELQLKKGMLQDEIDELERKLSHLKGGNKNELQER